MIRSRVLAGLQRPRARGVRLGRPRTGPKVEDAIRKRLAAGEGIKKVAKTLGVGNGTVSRIKATSGLQPHRLAQATMASHRGEHAKVDAPTGFV